MTRERIYREVARLHACSIDQGFLPKLGEGFLVELYRCIDEDDGTFLEVVEDGGHVVGFVAGTLGTKSLRGVLARHPFRIALRLLPSLLSPSRVAGALSAARYAGSAAGLPPGVPQAELLSIAVHESVRGKGHAESLFRALERRMQQSGIDRFRIIAGEALKPAHRFYRRMGAEEVAVVEIHSGTRSMVFCKSAGSRPQEEFR
jgi:ribosomal protein S18 acetylase RimI-like enzyme